MQVKCRYLNQLANLIFFVFVMLLICVSYFKFSFIYFLIITPKLFQLFTFKNLANYLKVSKLLIPQNYI